MQKIIKRIYTDKIAGGTTSVNALLLLFMVVVIAITYHLLPPYLPLYNKLAWGYQRLGNTYEIFLPIGFTLLIVIGNTYLGLLMQQKSPLLARLLFFTGVSSMIFTTIFICKLLIVVI